MARKTNYSSQKWEREKNRMKKRQEKQDRKQEAKDRKAALHKEGIDPDIAGIEPGPQPPIDPEE
jgi:hypothetical protein